MHFPLIKNRKSILLPVFIFSDVPFVCTSKILFYKIFFLPKELFKFFASMSTSNEVPQCLSEKDFVSSLLLKEKFIRRIILGWCLFSVSTLNILLYFLLTSMKPDQRYCVKKGILLLLMSKRWHFLLKSFKIFSCPFELLQFKCDMAMRRRFFVFMLS